MSVVETLLVFAGIPLGIILVLFVGVYGRSMARQPNRYRPGRPWDYEPTWYVPHPDAVVHPRPSAGATTATGGATGEW